MNAKHIQKYNVMNFLSVDFEADYTLKTFNSKSPQKYHMHNRLNF